MQKKLIHTPEGVRDIYGEEFRRKLFVEGELKKLIESYGYEDMQTPVFEFFDIFSGNIGTIPSKELYKFFDKEGNTLALRPDFTPSIARATAKYFTDNRMPLRFCYIGSTFNNTSDYQGRLKESTEIGVELIGDGSADADVEMLMMIIDSMLAAGLQEFQISVGNLEFFKGLCAEYGIDEENEMLLRQMINDKNYFGTEDVLDTLKLRNEVKDMISRMPDMFGGMSVLAEAKGYVSNDRSLDAIKRLEEIYDVLSIKGYEKYISFDLGMLSKYNYYTGIIFRAYTYGSGDAIVKGGRYDNLLSEFGKDSAAIGFCIQVDQLMSVLERQKISINLPERKSTLIIYDRDKRAEAIRKAADLRNEGIRVIMMNEETLGKIDVLKYAGDNGMTLIRI
ncbi:MAG TPA: ATP phosphoribosyltransferase regulatory subunit [Lachnospiraceae bacterium]|nr:ATP phosphoribosyltransferase regulatory subunit [Lachnospiraceae bacterium]